MTPHTDIAHWRSQIINRMIAIVLALGTLTAVPSIVMAVRNDMWPIVAVDVLSIVWLAALWRLPRLSYMARVVNFIAIVVFFSIALLVTVGYVAQIFLIAAPVFAVVLLGMRPALMAVAGSGLVILVLGLTGWARPELAGFPHEGAVAPILATLNYLLVGTAITVSCGTLLQKLLKSLDDVHQFADSLEDGKNALHAVNAELRLTAAAVAQLNDRVIIARATDGMDRPQPIIFANDACVRGTGYSREELLGQSMNLFVGPDTDSAEAARIVRAMAHGERVSGELLIYAKSGTPHWIELDISPFVDESGALTHWVSVGRDISERKKAATAIHRLAYYDVLTGLPNRRRLMEQLDARLLKAGNARGALLFIDLDHFKYVNDARGHAAGDDLLRNVAQVISRLVRGDDIVARLGGDEFVVLLTGIAGDEAAVAAAAMARARAIGAALAREVSIDSNHYSASASIGIALMLRRDQSADDLLREADTAMYRAKANGRNGVALFESTMRAEMEERLTLETDLANALKRGELAMHLQLQFDADARPAGAELLMRWRRADGKMVPPDVFIPVAESTGLIAPLGDWALHQACLAWRQLAEAGHAMPLSVNVSPSQFGQAGFVGSVQRLLSDHGMPPDQLILEVTEGIAVGDRDGTIARMRELADMGIRFSIDDFGTGYSNLAYLKRMPLYELKIDKSFIREAPGDADGTAIVNSILAMAAHLRLRVVAEGVETQEQAQYLMANGAPHMQGYLFARPMPLADVLAELAGLDEAIAGGAVQGQTA
ncbi:putative bifunctional diguanylate cyclase/phosphodiesterase [Pseudoduganella umbonata]|uniref:Diguanylate cyclase (GGDEF)-like protein/PAS domain S-box-containing protein n=2 Tax=Pseudoduganella umbonata TaxID=864828 RepID=A0A7W5HC10_9BURK|nr:GGDEF domain-containing phosphodiesterase [Pseudoduganella umbonata]MBB3223045.1 diguanylate cyclase (GGDEF)-like protein/PAS domain S-box-containing protein [Pseudoduganella umbonata]